MNIWNETYQNTQKLPWGNGIPKLLAKEKDLIKPYLTSDTHKNILDYGFGGGELMDYAKTFKDSHKHKVYGAETSKVAINRYLGTNNKNLIYQIYKILTNRNIAKVNNPAHLQRLFPKFDLILCFGVLHHINVNFHPELINGFDKIMNMNGQLIIAGWDKDDNFIKDGADIGNPKGIIFCQHSKVTNNPVYSINHLEHIIQPSNLELVDSKTIGFYDNMIYKTDRLMRVYVMEKTK